MCDAVGCAHASEPHCLNDRKLASQNCCNFESPEGSSGTAKRSFSMIVYGKSAVITGSTSGIGLAIARALAREGANVVINGLGEPAEIEEVRRSIERDYSVKAVYSPADMAKPDEIIAMVREADEAFGSVDVLVNNAGVQYVAAVEELPPEK